MENWKELIISTIIVLVVSIIFNFSSLPDGFGKLFAYLGVSFLPVLVVQFQKNSRLEKGLNTGEFIFALILNTFMVLFFAFAILIIMGYKA